MLAQRVVSQLKGLWAHTLVVSTHTQQWAHTLAVSTHTQQWAHTLPVAQVFVIRARSSLHNINIASEYLEHPLVLYRELKRHWICSQLLNSYWSLSHTLYWRKITLMEEWKIVNTIVYINIILNTRLFLLACLFIFINKYILSDCSSYLYYLYYYLD